MRLNDIKILMEAEVDWEEENQKTLDKTGFWGKQGAGCIIMAQSTKRILLPHRSQHVEQPNTWGVWGGAIDGDISPEQADKQEVSEEAGYHGPLKLFPLYVFKSGTFTYYNFLAVVKDEFKPTLNWETQGYKWVEYGDWPSPLHFGLENVLKDSASVKTITSLLK